MTKQLLVVENLDINFELHEKNVHAVRNVSFKVAEGETLAFGRRIRLGQICNIYVRYAPAA